MFRFHITFCCFVLASKVQTLEALLFVKALVSPQQIAFDSNVQVTDFESSLKQDLTLQPTHTPPPFISP